MLKNVLSLLLSKFYSKKESELVGHQAMPSSQSISITPTVNSVGDEVATVATFNAQADGFVIVRATTDGAPPSRLILSSYVSTYIFNNSAGGTIATFIPIAKGIQCTVQGRNLKNIVISLYKTIGGGGIKKALLRGGGLCLNSLSSSLRRSSWLTRRNGSDIRLFRITVLALTLRSNRTLHLQTDGLAFVRPLLNLIVLLTQRAELLHGFLVMRSHLLRQQQHCLFLRVKHLPSTSQAEYQKFGSHQLTVPQLNFALGGASC